MMLCTMNIVKYDQGYTIGREMDRELRVKLVSNCIQMFIDLLMQENILLWQTIKIRWGIWPLLNQGILIYTVQGYDH